MTTLMSLQAVNYKVQQKQILTDINLAIPAGADLTITGPSGSGKSTILQIMASMRTKTTGKLIFAGKSIEDYDPVMYRRMVSYCFQQPTLFGKTVADNLIFPYQIRKVPFDESQAIKSLDYVGLPASILEEQIEALSGGERQRVALIRNVLFLPRMLLLDEVTAGLDAANRQIIHQLIQHLNQDRNVTVVSITHDDGEIQAAKHVLIVEAGRIKGGVTDELSSK